MISVIIPLYNKEKTIIKTLNTVLSQDYVNFEILIINDGSNDNSRNLVKSIIDPRIKIFDIINSGVSSARNYGILKSKGDYLFFLDADDIIYSNCLSILIKAVQRYKEAQIFIANYYFVSKKGHKSLGSLRKVEGIIKYPFKAWYKNQLSCRTGVMLFKRPVLINEMFNKNISVHEDTDLWIRLLMKYQVVYIPEVIHEYIKIESELSENRIPINKEFCYYIKINYNQDKYIKYILAGNLLSSIIKRFFFRDYKTAFYILLKNKKNLHLILYLYIMRKLKSIFKY
jgi:glycosyltransferase involved in cell wall biosynthesis